jgi:hypothetical protein
MTLDISFLSQELRNSAIFTNNGREVMWPRELVNQVINALADHGLVILGLDLRSDGVGHTPPGIATEVPWSAYAGDAPAKIDVQPARADALMALRRESIAEFSDYRWVLVTWCEPGS